MNISAKEAIEFIDFRLKDYFIIQEKEKHSRSGKVAELAIMDLKRARDILIQGERDYL